MMDAKELWNQVKELYRGYLDTNTFDQTLKNVTEVYKVEDNIIYLVAEDSVQKYRIQRFYLSKLNELLAKINTDEKVTFAIISKTDIEKIEKKVNEIQTSTTKSAIKPRNLRSEYTFDNFVAGETNREAFVFSLKVCERPGELANPLYLFGDVGLGKTHLMTAIGHQILEDKPDANIVFTTAQQFVEDYYKSKNKNQKNTEIADNFDLYYRSADVLLVDDIQYLADRQGSQDEFFKLFEFLFENRKQIVVTSDRPADSLNIMDRLKSRFAWGVQSIIRKPNLKLREEILKKKLKYISSDDSIEVSDEVITFVAENFDQNVRDLEGALRRVIFHCVSFNYEINLENAQVALEAIISKDKVSADNNTVHIEKIKEIVASYFNISAKDLASQSRKQAIVYPRDVTVYILKDKYNLTLNKIGEVLGNRDHATIMHSYDKIKKALDSDSNVKEDIDNLIASLDKQYK